MAETVVESIVDKVVETLDSTFEPEQEADVEAVPNQEHNNDDDESTCQKCEVEPATSETSDNQTPTQQERQVKKTCEACVKSKVRCDGNSPCDRCLTRGVECFFIFEQKRGRRPGSLATVDGKKRPRRTTSKHKRPKMPNDTLKRHSSTESDISKQQDHDADGSPSVEKEGKEIPNGLRPPTATSMSSMFQRAPVDHNSGFSAFLVPPQNVPAPSSYKPMLFQANYFSPSHHMAMLQPHQPGPWTATPHHPPLPMPHQMMSSSSSSSAVGSQEMSPFERRVVRTLFALFKHHYAPTTDRQGHCWFETRFNRLWHYLERTEKVNQLELHGFTLWMLNHGMRLSRDLQMADGETEGEIKLANVPMQYRTVTNTNDLRSMVTITLAENGKITCGTNVLFFLSGDFDAPDRWPRARILPFGAEIVAEIALNDADVYGYVRDMAVQYEKAVAMQDGSSKQPLTVTMERPIVIVTKSGHQMSVILKVELVETASQPGSPRQQMITFNILFTHDHSGVKLVHEPDQILAPWPAAVGGYAQPSWINAVLHWARTMNFHHSS